MLKTRNDVIKEWKEDKENLDKFVCPECKSIMSLYDLHEVRTRVGIIIGKTLVCNRPWCNNYLEYTLDGEEI